MNEVTLRTEEFAIEVAYHEAAHYVLSIIANINDNYFNVPYSIDFYTIENEKYKNGVNVKLYVTINNIENLRQNYPNKISFELMISLSGFASYCVTEQELLIHEALISKDDILESTINVRYSFFNEIWNRLNELMVNHDIKKASATMTYLRLNGEQKAELIIRYFNSLVILLSEGNVREALEYVKDKLLKYNGSTIEGEKLQVIENHVGELVEDIDLTNYIPEDE